MFKKEQSLGFWETVVPILSSAISVGGQVASSMIQAETAKDVAKIQAETTQMKLATEERLAQLQLEALRQTTPVSMNTPTAVRVSPESAGLYVSSVGQPSGVLSPTILYLVLGGLLLVLLLRD